MNIISEHLEKDNIKNAVQWITEGREAHPAESVQKLVNKAIFKFNLSPAEAEFVIRFFHDKAA
jgi:hypothetical protein